MTDAKDHDHDGAFSINNGGYDWHFICYSYDGSKVRTYVDGAENWVWDAGLNTGSTKARISGHNGADQYSLNAFLDEFRIYSRVLTTSEMEAVRCTPFIFEGLACPKSAAEVAADMAELVGTVSAGLLFYSDFETGVSSDQVRDLSPNGHHGTHFSHEDKPVQADGGVAGGKCMLFYDSGSLIELPTSTIVTGNNARTVCFYLKRRPNNNLDSSDYAFGFGSSSIGQSFNSRFGGGKMGFMGYGKDHDGDGNFNINNDNYEWHHVCYSYAHDGKVRNYVDGVTNWAWAASLSTGSNKARIGCHNDGSTLTLDAYLDEFRIYNRELSSAEMATLRCQPYVNAGVSCPF